MAGYGNNTLVKQEVALDHCPVCEQGQLSDFLWVKKHHYLRCTVCSATVMAEASRLSEADEKAIYEYHENDPSDAGYQRFLSRLAQPLLQRISPGAQGLDFGCGPGPVLAEMLRDAGMDVSLYDPFFYPGTEMLDHQYDFITCTEVLEHLHRPADVFRKLDRLIKPEGWIGVMTCFQTDDASFANWHYRRDPTHVVFYRESTLQLIANRMGWTLVVPIKNVALFQKPSASTID